LIEKEKKKGKLPRPADRLWQPATGEALAGRFRLLESTKKNRISVRSRSGFF
jgi:hypothetical protein